MEKVTVDRDSRVRLAIFRPGERYAAEELAEGEIVLRRLPNKGHRMSREEILRALSESPIEFTSSWDELKNEVR